ncbi:MAG TPA: acyl-ACP thioesterase domain-containing protein [bacterium]|jgi:acyl-ACP thioesterase
MPSSFNAHFQVRYDECAVDGTVRASALLRYVVETAFAHSADKGFPLDWYDSHRLHWLVRRMRLELLQPVSYGAGLTVTTEVVGFRRIWARRRNRIADQAGARLGDATMDWIFTDGRGRPARVPLEMETAFPGVSERMDLEHLEVGSQPSGLPADEYLIPAHQVDPLGHMNSAAYVDLFDDALVALGVDVQARPAVYELEYFRAPRLGERLKRYVWEDRGGWSIQALDSLNALAAIGRRWVPNSHDE